MLKTNQPIISINGFHIGDKVRLIDGDGRPHIIKSFSIDGIKEFFFEVQFEDGTEAMLDNICLLPSNIDKAAEYFAKRQGLELYPFAKKFFKVGAEWLARQGNTKRGVVIKDLFVKFTDDTYIDLDPTMKLTPAFRLKEAEEVVVQVRKKH